MRRREKVVANQVEMAQGEWASDVEFKNHSGRMQLAVIRGSFVGWEYDRMVVRFSMIDGQREIPCAVSTSAMDDLEKTQRTKLDQREAQFMRLRDRIEDRAACKIIAREFEGTPPGVILRSIDF